MIAARRAARTAFCCGGAVHAGAKKCVFQLRVVHVNHGLRENAALDETFCRELCAKWHIPLAVFHVQVDSHGSTEDAARRARYAAFEQAMPAGRKPPCWRWHIIWMIRLKRVPMHLIYGSGMAGLSGMRGLSGAFWRPLLSVRRTQIRDALTALHQPWREDESNRRYSLYAQSSARVGFACLGAGKCVCRACHLPRG